MVSRHAAERLRDLWHPIRAASFGLFTLVELFVALWASRGQSARSAIEKA
jgi:hypothetical protein